MKFNDAPLKAYQERMKSKIEDALIIIGNMGVSWAADQLRINGSIKTSNLVNSLAYATSKEQSSPRGSTTGSKLSKPKELIVKIGSTVVYAARVEFGFVGKDSLGRRYNQPAKSYLRTSVANHHDDVLKIFKLVLGR